MTGDQSGNVLSTGETWGEWLTRIVAEDDPANGGYGLLTLSPPHLVIVTLESGKRVAGQPRPAYPHHPAGAVDIGPRCTHCGRDTGPGSGLFVNRIPSGWSTGADAPMVIGYQCADCQCIDCDSCGEPVMEYSAAPDGQGFWCDDCAEGNAAGTPNDTGKANPEVTQ